MLNKMPILHARNRELLSTIFFERGGVQKWLSFQRETKINEDCKRSRQPKMLFKIIVM